MEGNTETGIAQVPGGLTSDDSPSRSHRGWPSGTSPPSIKPSVFLRRLYGDDYATAQLAIWELPGRSTQWIGSDDLESSVDHIAERNKQENRETYFGVGLQGAAKAEGRGDAGGVVCVPGVWVDLDFANKPDAKKQYPTREQADRILRELMPRTPSIVLFTGGGYHAYWLFKEPYWITDDASRERIARLSQGWQALVRKYCAQVGCDLDSTWDLARVLRLPGSFSAKHQCSIDFAAEWPCEDLDKVATYDFEDLEPLIPEDFGHTPMDGKPRYVVGSLTLDETPVNTVALSNLLQNDPGFRKVWEHKKKFPSSSEYEMSLASIAVRADWPDQEIARLMIQHRMRWEPDKIEKLIGRGDYVLNTIRKAREESAEEQAMRNLEAATDAPGTQVQNNSETDGEGNVVANEPTLAADKRDEIVQSLSDVLGVPVSGWLQEGRENPIYSLITGDGKYIRLPAGVDILAKGAKVLATRIYEETGIIIKVPDPKKWATTLRALTRIGTVRDYQEFRATTSVGYWIDNYFSRFDHTMGADADEVNLAASAGEPFVKDGRVHLQVERLWQHINAFGKASYSKSVIVSCMRQCGFERVKRGVHFRREDGGRSTRSYWAAPRPADGFAAKLDEVDSE